jgi:RNA polymerase sigma-70 factor (ECF subfamily)
MQSVNERLFVPANGRPPRIVEYAGRASLRGWVISVARRNALNLRRRRDDRGHTRLSSTAALAAAEWENPEIAALKARYTGEVETAMRAAIIRLPARDRAVLLLHLVEGVTLPQLATMQRVSRATVVRRLAAARTALYEELRRELVARLRLTNSELASIIALVRSELDVSFVSAIRAAHENG